MHRKGIERKLKKTGKGYDVKKVRRKRMTQGDAGYQKEHWE